MDDKRTIGEKVKKLREDRGWSQGQLSMKMGLNNSAYISKLERGEIENPTFERLALMARALGVADWTLTGGAPPPGATDVALLNVLGDVFAPDKVQEVIAKWGALDPEYKQLPAALIDTLYENQERVKAERRAEVQRQKRKAQETVPDEDDPPEDEAESTPAVMGLLVPA